MITLKLKNLKIQMLAGNSLKMCVGVGFEISSTLVSNKALMESLDIKLC